ncbi:MAG: PAS domain-containing protein [Desulfobacteraceae bacterium]|nr:MAG: PAS domain-containing protein [Desulfobacteraceae bacterium]
MEPGTPSKHLPYELQMTGPQELSAILDMSAAGISRVKDRNVLWANATLCRMLGYDAQEIMGQDTRIFYASDEEYQRVGKVLYTGLEKFGTGIAETRFIHKNGTGFDCRLRASFLDRSDPEKGEVVVITDISEIKLLQIQLQQAQKMEAIGVLAGGVSHDFNNILMAIQGHLSLIQMDLAATEKIAKHIRHIGKLVKVAAELTTRLLGFARGGKYRLEIVNMNELCSQCLEKFISTKKDIRVDTCFEPDLSPVEADAAQLKQVMFNLFINASQAMTEAVVKNEALEKAFPGKELRITTANLLVDDDHHYPFKVDPGKYIKITVTDNGIGMDERVQKKVFDPFFSTRELDDMRGTGLGLSTVFGIVKNHNGYITLDSEPMRGASFHVHLPVLD